MKSPLIPICLVILLSLTLTFGGCGRSSQPEAATVDSALVLIERGQTYMAGGQTDSARLFYNEAMSLPALPDSVMAYIFAELSASYQIDGDMRRSLDYGKMALLTGDKVLADEDFGILAGNIGIAYRRLGMNDSAAVFYKRGIDRMLGKSGNEDVTAFLYNNLSVLYCEMLRFGESLDFARKAQPLARKADDDVEYYSALANEGITLVKMDSLAQGMERLLTVFERAEETGSRHLVLKTANYLAATSHELGDEPARLRYINAGLEAASGYPPESVAVQGMIESKMHYCYDHGDYSTALSLASRLDSISSRMLVLPAYKLKRFRSLCLSALGYPAEALALEREATAIQDSVASSGVEAQLSEYSVRLKTQETEIALLKAERKAGENAVVMWIFVAAFILVASVLVIWVVISRSRRRKEEQAREIERSARYIEGLEAERVRMAHELHDGACNDLLGICYALQVPDIDRDMILGLVSELRASLRRISHDQMPPEFRYADLNEILADYTSHLSLPAGVSVVYTSSGAGWPSVPPSVAYQYYRIAQEAISNSLRHAGAGEVRVSLTLSPDGRLRMTVSDSGRGLEDSSAADTLTGGLSSMRDRARGIGADFSFSAENGAASVVVTYGKP